MDTLVFVLGRLAALAFRPDVWLAIGVAVIMRAAWRERHRVVRVTSLSTLIAVLGLGFLPLGDLAMRPLETRHPPAPHLAEIDGIVVLGGAENGDLTRFWGPVQLNDAAERMTEGLMLARRHRQAALVFTGGAGALRAALGEGVPGARVAERFFRDQGMDMDRVILEEISRTTAENARYALRTANPGADETWVLVTSAFHMTRALRSFHAVGWPGELVAWPVDHRGGPLRLGWDLSGQSAKLQIAMREYVGLLAYRALGRG